MKKLNIILFLLCVATSSTWGQVIPLDTAHWEVSANAYVLEQYQGQEAIYLQAGSIALKDRLFLDGTIEYDIMLKEEQCFPGVYFRMDTLTGDAEQFYIRPHQSGNPDANQTAPVTKQISPWQLYFGERYSFPYEYKFDDWTHVKILVNGNQAQVFLDHATEPHFSWELFHPEKSGVLALNGGMRSGLHIANIQVSHVAPEIVNFKPIEKKPIEGLVPTWQISNKFEENKLSSLDSLPILIEQCKWITSLSVVEGTAVNISQAVSRYDQSTPGNTVMAKIIIRSDSDQIKRFDFGYSDRVVAILNGQPLYYGNNRWRSRDYRYLGTIGLFDGIYLPLKKGRNELVMAVSEDFGGWLITGKFQDNSGIKLK